MSIDPKIWGASGWVFLHSIVLAYPNQPNEKDKINMKKFFNSVPDILPCEECRVNMKKHMIELPLNDKVLESKFALAEWINKLNDMVNKLVAVKKKKAKKESVEDAVDVPMKKNPFTNIVIVMLCILLVLGVLYQKDIKSVIKNKV